MNYHVEIVNNRDSRFRVKSADYEFVVDTKGQGITPPDTLLASLGSCIGVYVRKYAEGAKISLPEFKVFVDAQFSKDPPYRFREISVTIDLQGAMPDERRKNALMDFVRNCPVHNTLESKPVVNISLI